MDPNNETQPGGELNPDAAAAAADGTDGTQQPGGDAPQVTESETAAFDKGVEAVKAAEAAEAGKLEEAQAAATAGAEGTQAAGAKPGEGAKTPEELAAAAAAKPDAAKPDGKTDPKQAVEDEIKSLGLKEKAAERFRDLTNKVAEMEPLRARAAMADEWEQTVLSTGADPQQFGAALGYLKAVNSGDPAQLRAAYDQIAGELKTLGEMLGMPAPGVDPLAAHADLVEAVRKGDMDRQLAEELAQRRATEKLTAATTTQRNTQDQQQRAQQDGMQAVAALGARLKATDLHFDAKYKSIEPLVNGIQRSLPPAQWAAAIEELWKTIPTPTVTPITTKPPTSSQPLRPTGSSTNQMRKPKTDEEAFSFGVDVARASGV